MRLVMKDKKLTQEEVDNILSVNARLKKAIEDLKEVFSNKFYLTQKDLEGFIIDIVSNCDEEITENLSYIFLEFVENDIENFDIRKRRAFAKTAVKNCLDLYNKEINQIQNGFFGVLKEAKKYNIDPFRLAIKENLRGATADSFNETLQALVFAEYNGISKDKKEKLFQESDIKRLFEQCAGLASGVSEKCVQNILNVLSRFVRDEKGDYIVNPRNIISKCLSLLDYGTPKKLEKLESMIEFLQEKLVPNEMSKRELVLRVAENPSVLLLTQEKVLGVENQLIGAIYKIVTNPNFTGKIEDIDEFVINEAQRFSYNFDNFNEMRALRQDRLVNLDNICDVLISNLGADNALKCITNMRILNTDTAVLDCFLTKLAVQEKESNLNLRKFFIENPYRCLNLLEEENVGAIIAERMGGHRRTKSVKATDVPEGIKDEDFKVKYSKLNIAQKKKVDELSQNVLEEIARKRREAREKQKQNKFEYENLLVNGVRDRLSTVVFKTPYAYILTKYKMLLDEKYGVGYAQKNYNIDDFINFYNEMVDTNEKFAEMNEKVIGFADEIGGIGKIEISENANLLAIKNISNEFMAKFEEFAEKFTTFEKEEVAKNLREPQYNIVTLSKKFGFYAHDKFMKDYKEIFNYLVPSVYVDFTDVSSCMSYLEMMTDVMKKEFPNFYETISPEYERESLMCQDIPISDKVSTIYNISQTYWAMIVVFKNFIEKEFNDSSAKVIEQVGGFARRPGNSEKNFDLNNIDVLDRKRLEDIQRADKLIPFEEKRLALETIRELQRKLEALQKRYISKQQLNALNNRIDKVIKGLNMYESGRKLYFSIDDLKDESIDRHSFSILKNESNKENVALEKLSLEEIEGIDDLPLNNYMAYIIPKYAGIDNRQIEEIKRLTKETAKEDI